MPITCELEDKTAMYFIKASTKAKNKKQPNLASNTAEQDVFSQKRLDEITESCANFFSQNITDEQLGNFVEI